MDVDEPDINSDNCNIPVVSKINSVDMDSTIHPSWKSETSPSSTTPVNVDERPTTPPNNFDIFSTVCTTPVLYNHCNHTDSETSFLKRIAHDQLVRRRFTSTPVQKSASKFSNTFPFSQQPSSLSDNRQWRSAENKKLLKDPEQVLVEYVNPFTPDGKLIHNRTNAQKRLKKLNLNSVFGTADSEKFDEQTTLGSDNEVPARHRLNELNVFRYNEEFVELDVIGKGYHGCVYKCINMINGCIYAIKKTIHPVKSGIEERTIQNEIYAHGVLDHCNIVRNFSSWKEGVHVYIQNEYCNGGNLEDYCRSKAMTEHQLTSLLLQMSHALRYIHNKGLAHMDVKPGNILLCIERSDKDRSIDSDCGFSDEDKSDDIIFKLGDLGHIIRLDEKRDVEEGDCRYFPRELLEEQFNHLDRADIFALGLTVYEAAGGGPLPKNGDEWHKIRNGHLKHFDQYSKHFNDILKSMVHPIPERRPSAEQLIQMLEPSSPSVSEDVFGYLQRCRQTNSLLEHRVEATGLCLKYLFKAHKQLQEQVNGKDKVSSSDKEKVLGISKKKGGVTKNRVVGKKTKRSSSTTIF